MTFCIQAHNILQLTAEQTYQEYKLTQILQLMIPTSQGKSLEMEPLSLSTSLASNHHISPMLLEPLLLHGTAMSMNLVGESMLQSATIGMLA